MHRQSVTLSLPDEDAACAGHKLSVPFAQCVSTGHSVHGPPAARLNRPTAFSPLPEDITCLMVKPPALAVLLLLLC